jgi:hypothetical protein
MDIHELLKLPKRNCRLDLKCTHSKKTKQLTVAEEKFHSKDDGAFFVLEGHQMR